MESEGKAALLLLLINKRPRDQTPFELLLGVAQGLAGRDRAFPYEEVTRRIRPENLVVANNADSLSVQSIAAHAALAAQTIGLAPDLDTLHRQPFSTPTGLKGTVVWFYCSEAAPIAKPAFEHAQTPTPSEPGKKWWRFLEVVASWASAENWWCTDRVASDRAAAPQCGFRCRSYFHETWLPMFVTESDTRANKALEPSARRSEAPRLSADVRHTGRGVHDG